MQIFKFGGASISTIERIQNVAYIIQQNSNDDLIVVISAMGKTTNALEKVAEAFYSGDTETALRLFDKIKQEHIQTAKYLLIREYNSCLSQLSEFFTEVEWLLHDKPARHFDYYYDQVVCIGELLSSCIISHYIREENIDNSWLDVRDLIRTDNNFRDAAIDWEATSQRINNVVSDSLKKNRVILTQGFIGSTFENESVTLGREGSDYTAAIFANIMNVNSLTIWKDVKGVMNADPKVFPDAQVIDELSYKEVIEMAYYGAQVIHPKTIKPLQNKSITLYVKCFLDDALPGTAITNKHVKKLPPIIVMKENQVFASLTTTDYSFVGENAAGQLYSWLEALKIKPNLIQSGAISIQLCFDFADNKIEQFTTEAAGTFDITIEKSLSLLTIRHYTKELVDKMLAGKEIVLLQQTEETIQVLYRGTQD